MDYTRYTNLKVELHEHGIAEVILGDPGKLPAADATGHGELADIWRDLDRDPAVAVIVVRGQDKGFSAGGTLDLVAAMVDDFEHRARVWKEARDIVYNMINCSKVIVSAINGPAVGGGLAVALLADISIAAKNARLIDGHTRLGVAAGDHAAIIWPLLCGMAKAKLHLLLSNEISGEEAERIGLVSMAVEADALRDTAFDIAKKLAAGPQTALRWTKHSLNNWLRQAGPIFDNSVALEMLGFTGPEVREGLAAVRERRTPNFPAGAPI
ncbi:enoyl-CoA hydratase/isomerase family protein [Aromatoleum toluclasticum]|uniref:enoyl-CoA hydratase/isomerase family protein n=1 Tax=Aromatoleum toluclasticum TaxID=92003 RepID=UPI001D183EE8|nr:enoyl-CoA hydratase/isomerase family protein [Aromatoleum toluclasticum]MCC4113788.1 enoyl-CoA hydratase/isomerase family protein [Aromatoleum toluclasticum]